MSLTARVTAAKTWTDGELVTSTKLNQTATPSVDIEGTVAAASIGAGSVGPTQLNASVSGAAIVGGGGAALAVQVDGSTIEISSNALRNKDGGITAAKLATDAVSPLKILFGAVALGTSGAVTIDCSLGLTFKTTLTGNITGFTLSNMREGQSILIAITQSGGGSNTIAWTTTVLWRAGVAPVLTVTASKTDIISIVKIGSTYFGNYSQNY